jgi:hypothetical protein
VGGRAGSLDRTEAVGGQRRVNAVPIPANLSSVGIIAMPESAIEESNIDVLYREAISAVWDAAGAGMDFGVCSGRSRTRALVARSAEAALLVVGTHEHVGFPGWSRVR